MSDTALEFAALGLAPATRVRPVPLLTVWAWQARAACRGEDPDLFFHPDGERDHARADRERAAKAVCARCPVVRQCAAHALAVGERYGVWGGLSEGERQHLLAQAPGEREPRPAAG